MSRPRHFLRTNPPALLTRKQAAAFLARYGYPVPYATLESYATRSGGPPFRPWGSKAVLYHPDDLLRWAMGRLGPTVTSTSELDALRQPDKRQRRGGPRRLADPTQ